MDAIEGTNVGQVNLQPTTEIHNSVGSAFATVNPPMSAQALAIKLSEVPKPFHVASEQPTIPTLSPAALMAELTTGNPQLWREQPICGVVTINNQDWRPNGVRSVPPSLVNGLGMTLAAKWVMLFNASPTARRRRHWAVLTTRATVLILTGIKLQDRPVNVCDFPACSVGGLLPAQAEQMATDANSPRHEVAQIPRFWTVAIRRADSVEAEVNQ